MPDLMPVGMSACTAAQGDHVIPASDGKKTYTVTCHDRWEWTCSCPAFKFKPDDWCKHIKEVRQRHCHWNELVDGGRATDEGKCPQCGGEVEHFTMMV